MSVRPFPWLLLLLLATSTIHAANPTLSRKARAADRATTTATSLDLFRQGETAMALGNYERAEQYFKTAFERERRTPTLETPLRRKLAIYAALAYQNNSEPERAVAMLREALGKDPRYPLFHYFLAVALSFEHLARVQGEEAAPSDLEDPPAQTGRKGARAETQGASAPLQASDEIFESLRRVYLLKDNLGPGEKIPNPRTDMFLGQLRHDPRFQAVLDEAGPAAAPDIIADLDELARAGEDAGPDQQQAVAEELEAGREMATPLLLRRLAGGELSEPQRVATIWALGRTADPQAAEPLAHVMFQPEMLPLKGAVLEALSRIGGPVAGNALLAELREARDDNDRFLVLTLLANMQFEPAIPLMMDLLGMDSEQAANQMAYCFGKMGSRAVPLLLGKIADPDKTTRINAINMLAWLCPSRAMIPLQKQYAQERDPEVRLALLGALSQLMRPDQFETLLKAGLAHEPDRENRGVMQDRLAQLGERKALFEKFKREKVNDRAMFAAAYDALFKSYGQAGTLEALTRASAAQDEPDLERLRARILDRQSEECFADFMKINRIIAFNRMIEPARPASNVSVQQVDTLKEQKGSGSPGGSGVPAVPSLPLPGLRNQ